MSIETTHLEQQLIERYGLLISRKQLAELLHRTEKALDHTLYHPAGCQLAVALNAVKVKFGRSVYFPAADVAALLCGGRNER
ncbi:hypothetical protein [Aquipseudomonas alcaligenes]|uniref:hypothetical protein n=1 Tax=Aquipseudomonas alcaligenes TaxID=43263 RepID=UPI00165A0B5B|nr:hypothetical protein [Pseudomonas alcaligenes]